MLRSQGVKMYNLTILQQLVALWLKWAIHELGTRVQYNSNWYDYIFSLNYSRQNLINIKDIQSYSHINMREETGKTEGFCSENFAK